MRRIDSVNLEGRTLFTLVGSRAVDMSRFRYAHRDGRDATGRDIPSLRCPSRLIGAPRQSPV